MADKPSELDALRYSAYSALVFFIVSSPFILHIAQRLVGTYAVNVNGYATMGFLIFRALVFFAIIYGMMHLKL